MKVTYNTAMKAHDWTKMNAILDTKMTFGTRKNNFWHLDESNFWYTDKAILFYPDERNSTAAVTIVILDTN